jgi:hypothetical protein
VPFATGTIGAAAGVAGGVLLGRSIANRPKHVLGMTIPQPKTGLSEVAKSINAAGKEFGKLAGEVQSARKKAEQIGKALG